MLNKLICNEGVSLMQALKLIDSNTKGILFIVDSNKSMIGTLTDGDIRRALLQNIDLSEPVESIMNKDYSFARETESHEEISQKISEKIRLLPILNSEDKVVDFFQYDKRVHLPISSPMLKGNEFKYLMDAYLSSWISSSGEYIQKFEDNFSQLTDSKFGVATSNGTTAIHLALEALGIGEGDEVIVPDLTFAATINTVLHANAKPVIVDIESSSWCICPKEIEKAITPKTKAIIVVHVYGMVADMDSICSIAKKHNLKIIEDCAEAHGAKYKGKVVGSIGDVGCFSFFANKIITTGEGGMCVTNSKELNDNMRVLRDHGMDKERRYWHNVVGYNYRMTNLQAAIGVAQLEKVKDILSFRSNLEEKYKIALAQFSSIKFQNEIAEREKVVWLVCALITESNRDNIITELKKEGIDCRPFFYPLSSMPVYKPYASLSYENSEELSRIGINFPTNKDVSDDNLKTIKNTLSRLLK